MFLVSNFGAVPDFPRRCLSVVLRLHGQGSAYVPFTSRGHDYQVENPPTGCPRHCATLFHQVASVVFVSTDKRTGTNCYIHSGLSCESLPFSLFAGFCQFPSFLIRPSRPRLAARVYPLRHALPGGGLVVVYLEVCVLELQLLMSVMQAMGWRIVHIWVWLHEMYTFENSGEPLPIHCRTKFTTAGIWTSLKCRVSRAWQQLLRMVPSY